MDFEKNYEWFHLPQFSAVHTRHLDTAVSKTHCDTATRVFLSTTKEAEESGPGNEVDNNVRDIVT